MTSTHPLVIGMYPDNDGTPGNFFNGTIDGVALYGWALSDYDIAARFNDGPRRPAERDCR